MQANFGPDANNSPSATHQRSHPPPAPPLPWHPRQLKIASWCLGWLGCDAMGARFFFDPLGEQKPLDLLDTFRILETYPERFLEMK